MKKYLKKLTVILLTIFLLINGKIGFSQVLISNGTGTPDNSAMLEIQSNSKGLLIPRLTKSQRISLTASAKEGLLVYDTDNQAFFIFGKDSKGAVGWYNISANAGLWSQSGNAVYLSNSTYNVGIGTSTPSKKLVIKAENATDTLLEIQDQNGAPIMVVTPSLTKFNIIKGNKGIKGTARGFAVGRYSLAKAAVDSNLFVVTPDSTRVYTGTAGGFAVGRYSLAKGIRAKFFYTGFDSTRVYTDGSGKKGTAGGFAVGRYSLAKGSNDKYVLLTEQNSFIGYKAGINTTTGIDNVFIGKNSGINNLTGNNNVYIGNLAGSNASASGSTGNIFIGNSAGSLETGSNKLYISNSASDSDGALIYGDFSSGSESVNLNGNLRFNKGGNTIQMPTTRGNINEVLTIGAGGSTNWENVNNLVTFPAAYVPPIVLITYENNFPFQDDDNIGTLIVKTPEGNMDVRLPLVEGNESRIIKVKNNRQGQTINVYAINPDIIEGVPEQPLVIEEGETYTFQAGVDKNTGETIWYIIDYNAENQFKNLLKETADDYNFNTDPDGERVYTLVITDARVNKIIIPRASRNKNRVIVIKNASPEAKQIEITPDGSDLIDGNSNPVIIGTARESYMLQSNGIKNWYIINHYLP